ncbi:hypothetical protein GW891_04670 [bacterium]|nr:hypothetical protein [bacterium]
MKQLIIKLKQIKFFDLAKKEAIDNKVKLEKIKENWLNWHNDARYNSKLKTYYSYDEILDNTAFQWSINNKEK